MDDRVTFVPSILSMDRIVNSEATELTHLASKHPYKNTRVNYNDSKQDIQEMLAEFGVIGLNWKENTFSLKRETMPELSFMLRAITKGEERKFAVLIKPPMLMKKKGNRYSEDVADPDASMRLLYWYLKARLEGVRFGLEDIFDAFLSRVITALPDGTTSTVAETIREHPEVLSKILPTFTINAPQLTEKRQMDDEEEQEQGVYER